MTRDSALVLVCGALVCSALVGCGGTVYMPRPSPRIQVVPDGNSVALIKNGRPYSLGLLSGGLEEAVRGNPPAEAEARTYHDLTVASFVLSTLGGVSAGVGAGLLIYDESRATSNNTVAAGAVSALVAGITFTLVGGILSNSAHPHLWNAVNLYNDGIAVPVYPGWPAPTAPLGAPPALPFPLTAPVTLGNPVGVPQTPPVTAAPAVPSQPVAPAADPPPP